MAIIQYRSSRQRYQTLFWIDADGSSTARGYRLDYRYPDEHVFAFLHCSFYRTLEDGDSVPWLDEGKADPGDFYIDLEDIADIGDDALRKIGLAGT